MGLRDSIGDFERRKESHNAGIASDLRQAQAAVGSASAQASTLCSEAADLLRRYRRPTLFGVPTMRKQAKGPHGRHEVERLGLGWYIGSTPTPLAILEDGRLFSVRFEQVGLPPEPMKPKRGNWETREHFKGTLNGYERKKAEYSAYVAGMEQLIHRGLKEGDRYFDAQEQIVPATSSSILPLVSSSWKISPARAKQPGVSVGQCAFSEAVRANYNVRDESDPAGFEFVSDSTSLLPPERETGGLQLGTFENGRPVLYFHQLPRSGGSFVGALPEERWVWDLEKLLSNRIKCVIEECGRV